jgi:hypothetical protein
MTVARTVLLSATPKLLIMPAHGKMPKVLKTLKAVIKGGKYLGRCGPTKGLGQVVLLY